MAASGCASYGPGPSTRQGAVLGGLLGAAAGGIVGHQSGRGLEGAAIGAGFGTLGGGVWGSSLDMQRGYQRSTTVIHY